MNEQLTFAPRILSGPEVAPRVYNPQKPSNEDEEVFIDYEEIKLKKARVNEFIARTQSRLEEQKQLREKLLEEKQREESKPLPKVSYLSSHSKKLLEQAKKSKEQEELFVFVDDSICINLKLKD